MKTHFISEVKPVLQWPGSIDALCGATIERPRGVVTVDLERHELWAENTINFCDKCVLLVLAKTEGRRWIYGILTAEEAHRANLRNRSDD